MHSKNECVEALQKKVKGLIETTWDHVVNLKDINAWLAQFGESSDPELDEQLHALYLLSHFTYYDEAAIRELLRSIFRDLYRIPILHRIRRSNQDTLDDGLIEAEFKKILSKTRFLGIGNPSESGVHLLYFFRQENNLPKTLFINSHEVFKRDASSSQLQLVVRDPTIENYIYLDDLCGSGTQAESYSKEVIRPLKQLHPAANVSYFVLFATSTGLDAVRGLGCFDHVSAIFELDDSFKCLEPNSRVFQPEISPYLRNNIRKTCKKFGDLLWPSHPLGYKDGQLLVGFNHNTPDNTLPIFWCNEHLQWQPIFKRYHKDDGAP